MAYEDPYFGPTLETEEQPGELPPEATDTRPSAKTTLVVFALIVALGGAIIGYLLGHHGREHA